MTSLEREAPMVQRFDERVEIVHPTPTPTGQDRVVIVLDPQFSVIQIGGPQVDGSVILKSRNDSETLLLNRSDAVTPGPTPSVAPPGHHLQYGNVVLKDSNGNSRVRINGDNATIEVLAPGGQPTVVIDGSQGQVAIGTGTATAKLHVGGQGDQLVDIVSTDPSFGSHLRLAAVTSNNRTESQLQFRDQLHLVAPLGPEGGQPVITVFQNGRVGIGTDSPQALLHVDGGQNHQWGMIVSSGGGSAYGLKVNHGYFQHDHVPIFQANALDQNKEVPRFTIKASGTIEVPGDIVLTNADCAEDFDAIEGETLEPGDVVVAVGGTSVRPCRTAYDPRVAGVVSGADGSGPGIIFGHDPGRAGRVPVALTGRVHCKVVANESPIAVGDLLTTAARPGHAMKASDPSRAFGAVLGKALGDVPAGIAVVPVLVGLK
jgi:hypothetical protein